MPIRRWSSTSSEGKITDPGPKAAIEGALAKVKTLKGVVDVGDPFAEGGTISPDQRLASVDVRYSTDPSAIKKPDGEALIAAGELAEKNGVQFSARGMLIDIGSEQDAPVGELIGVFIAIFLLAFLFRSWVAMAATLVGALIGVAIGQTLLIALAAPLDLPAFASVIASMLGLGAGIDYALLIIGRYREQVAAGRQPARRVGQVGRDLRRVGGRRRPGRDAGDRRPARDRHPVHRQARPRGGDRRRRGRRLGDHDPADHDRRVRPPAGAQEARARAAVAGLRPLGGDRHRAPVALDRGRRARPAGLRAPVTQLRLGQPDDGNQPTSKLQRVAYDRLSGAFGPGSNGPFLLAIDIPKGGAGNQAQLEKLQKAVAGTPGMAQVAPAAPSQDGEMATIFAIPKTAPQDQATSDLLADLRDNVIPKAVAGTPLKVYVGGNTAGFEDFSDKVASRLPVFIAVVIGLSVLLLIMAFRSLWIPLVSALFNLLSVGAAYGVVTAVFQQGVGASLLGVESGVPIVSFIPVMMFAILFGLSMDYNVFLLSRIHEAYNEGDRPRESVIHGLSRIGKVILFAGLIMASVFLAFVTQPDVIAKMFGLGLGLAVLIDVLIVRMVIAPAVVMLLGDHAWWLPRWLDRILPNVSLEGHLVEGLDAKEERELEPAGVA